MHRRDEILRSALNEFGLTNQLRALQEEAAELIAAVNHYLRGRADGLEHLKEELADVEIMVSQIKMKIPNEDLVDSKLQRLEAMINANKERASAQLPSDR